jgi:anaerobic selenocysteine-containing dehydrogenase
MALAHSRNVLSGPALLLKQNQASGFDCPGRAWPGPKHTSSFEFCENGAKAVSWEATSKRVTPEFFAQHTVSELWEKTDHWLEDQGRLTHPMAYDRATDRFVAVSWDDACTRIARVLNHLPSPDMVYMNARDMERAGLAAGLQADIWAVHQPAQGARPRVLRALTVVEYPLPEGCCGVLSRGKQPRGPGGPRSGLPPALLQIGAGSNLARATRRRWR